LLLASAFFLATAFSFAQTVKGPIVDKILFDAKTQEEIGLKDVAEGRSDFWNYTSSGSVFKALTDDVKNKLDVYSVTGVTTHSLLMNPYPNAAPYIVKSKDPAVKDQFNPFAITEVRYAMNWLISRQKIVTEILNGAGVPMFNAVTPGQPNASKYGLLAGKLGMTANGNEKKAIADIDAAITKASQLPENSGKLVKGSDGFWAYNGAPVSVKFLIRVDDPSVRLPMGRYIADQIEKAGIKVERLEYDRAKCRALWNNSDPASYQWALYTEGWGGGQTYAFWEVVIGQMYSPNQSLLPGYGNGAFWQYENAETDKLTGDANNGRVKDVKDYYDKLFKAVNLGMKDSVRVFLDSQTSYLAANKARFNGRMAYGLGDGIDKWSWYTADVKPETSGADKGLKVARMTSFSARGALFMSSWDPVGPNGFSDTYSAIIMKQASDMEYEANPVTGLMIPLRATHTGMKTSIETTADGKVVGKVPVAADAVLWNAKTQKWESGWNYVDVKGDASVYDYVKPATNVSYASATFAFKFGTWHDGRPVDLNDYRYVLSLPYDVSVKKGDSDKVYEEEYASAMNVNLVRYKGYKFNKDNTITVWADVNYPMDENQQASLMVPSLMLEGANYGAIVGWPVLEAIKGIVSEGNASKTAYSYNSDSKFTEVDLLSEACVKDLRAKLVEYAAAKRVPAALAATLTPDQAAKAYNLAIAFIDKHGNAYISNGAFLLDRYDAKNNTGALVAFRDPAYPYAKGYWVKYLTTSFTRVDNLNVATYKKGADTKVTAQISEVGYPSAIAKAAASAKVTVTLVADKEYSFPAKATKAGTYEAVLPAKTLDTLKAGSYTIVVESSLGTESPTVETSNVLVF
jgi:peptide/nickel transport system substrate-binding protein